MKKQSLLFVLLITIFLSQTMTILAQEESDIIETLQTQGNFTQLITALQVTDLSETLKGEGPYTLFAPTDEAFASLPPGTMERLMADPESLKNVMLFFVVPVKLTIPELKTQTSIDSLLGQPLEITVSGNSITINGARITLEGLEASNGIIHAIDVVYLSSEMESALVQLAEDSDPSDDTTETSDLPDQTDTNTTDETSEANNAEITATPVGQNNSPQTLPTSGGNPPPPFELLLLGSILLLSGITIYIRFVKPQNITPH